MENAGMALPSEIALLKQSVSDVSAFADVYDHYFPRIYNYIRYRVQEATTTDDLTAQVFERALSRIEQYDAEKGPFAAWLFTIARNTVNDFLRKHQRQRWLSLDFVSEWASSDPHPSDVVADQETRSQLLAAVARLSKRDRDLIGLKFAGGLTNRRIAELTGLKEGNVAIILHRAMRKLRTELEGQGVGQ